MGNISHNVMPDFREEAHHGTVGWAILGGFVLAWDVFAPETLSGAVDRALERPYARVAAVAGVLTTGAHLLNMIPERYDPFIQAFGALDKVRDII